MHGTSGPSCSHLGKPKCRLSLHQTDIPVGRNFHSQGRVHRYGFCCKLYAGHDHLSLLHVGHFLVMQGRQRYVSTQSAIDSITSKEESMLSKPVRQAQPTANHASAQAMCCAQ